jgi:hypothetical protein
VDDWDECRIENAAITQSIDERKSKSLQKVSNGRIKYLEKQKITKEDINYIFEGYYTSIVELLHAITINKGFKVNNHICLGYYLRDVLKKEKLFRIFDDLRYKRNSLVYYGKDMEFEIAKEAIVNSKNLIEELIDFQ